MGERLSSLLLLRQRTGHAELPAFLDTLTSSVVSTNAPDIVHRLSPTMFLTRSAIAVSRRAASSSITRRAFSAAIVKRTI